MLQHTKTSSQIIWNALLHKNDVFHRLVCYFSRKKPTRLDTITTEPAGNDLPEGLHVLIANHDHLWLTSGRSRSRLIVLTTYPKFSWTAFNSRLSHELLLLEMDGREGLCQSASADRQCTF